MLFIESKKYKVFDNISDLQSIKLTKPTNAGKYWQGIKHSKLAQTVTDCINDINWAVLDTVFCVDDTGQSFTGSWSFAAKRASRPSEHFSLGLTTNNSMKRSTSFYVGVRTTDDVSLCLPEGLGLVFYRLEKMKHTKGQDTKEEINDRVNTIRIMLSRVFDTSRKFYDTDISNRIETILLHASTIPRLITWNDIRDIYKACEKENRGGMFSAYQLCCLYAYQIRNRNPMLQMDNLFRFGQLMPINVPQ